MSDLNNGSIQEEQLNQAFDRILLLENKISNFSSDMIKFFILTPILGGLNVILFFILDKYGGRDAWMFSVGFSILYALWIIVYVWRMYERLGREKL